MADFNSSYTGVQIEEAIRIAYTVEEGAEVNNISDVNATDLTDSGDTTLHYHSSDRDRANHTGTQSADTITDGTTNKAYTATEKTKLAGIETGAEVNNISDVNATDLTDSGDSSLHYHSSDRDRANHTGTQSAATISDFDTEVSNNTDVSANTSNRHSPSTLGTKNINESAIGNGKVVSYNSTSGELEYVSIAGGGDMLKSTYDPTNISADAFDRANHTGTQSADTITDGTTNKAYTATEKTKLAGIETGAEVNNISDVNATDLTDSGDSSLHYHSSDRDRANHTGTQSADTISDFDTEVSNNTDVSANTSYRGVGHIPLSQKAANNGVATLDAGGKIPSGQLPSSVMDYKGTWNAAINSPYLFDGTGDSGDVYLCTAEGIQDLGSGSQTFSSGDWVVYNGTIWEKSINSNAVVSVNSQTGVVSLDSDDISQGVTNLYLTGNEFQKTTDTMDNITNGATYVKTTNDYTATEKTKLAGIETGAEVNNISDVNATDLTDSGDSSLHYHSSDRDRANHTGTQSADTITDGTTNKAYTATEKTKLAGIETGAEVNDNQSFIIACSDETSDLTTGTGKVTFRMPYAFTVTAVRASVTTAPTGATIIVDINEGGASILSTKLSIDAGEKTSTTAVTAPVISDSSLADDAEITIDIDQVGSTVAGTGLKVTIIGQVV